MRALEVEAAGADVTDFERGVGVQAFLHRGVPLLDVLRGGMWIEGGETDGGCGKRAGTENGRAEIHARVEQRGGRGEVVGLLRFGKYEGDIVALVAPGILVDRSKEDSVSGVDDETPVWQVFGYTDARSEIVRVRIQKAAGIAVLAADEDCRHAIAKDQIGVGIVLVVERAREFVAHAHIERERWRDLPAVFDKFRTAPVTQIHL